MFSPGAGQLRQSFEQVAERPAPPVRARLPLGRQAARRGWRAIKVVVSRPGCLGDEPEGVLRPVRRARARQDSGRREPRGLAEDEHRVAAVDRVGEQHEPAGRESHQNAFGITLARLRSEAIHCTMKRPVNIA